MLDVIPSGVLPPGYGDYGAAGGRSVTTSPTSIRPTRPTLSQSVAASGLTRQAAQAAGFKTVSPTAPLAIPDFDTWNVGAGLIEKVPASNVQETAPWYMNKWVWAAGGVTVLGLGYFLFFRNKGASRFAGFGG